MTHDIVVERQLRVSPEVAFHHWVDAEARRNWYRGDHDDWVVIGETHLHVGGRYVVRWGPSAEDAYQEEGEFLVVDPPHRLVYTSRFTPRSAAEGEPFELQVTVTFDAHGDGTLLRLVEAGYPSAETRDAFLRNGSGQGLDFFENSLPASS